MLEVHVKLKFPDSLTTTIQQKQGYLLAKRGSLNTTTDRITVKSVFFKTYYERYCGWVLSQEPSASAPREPGNHHTQ